MPGSGFVFGYLVTQQPFLPGALGNASLAFNVTSEVNLALAMPSVVVFKTLSVIYFFSFVCNILFYVGAVQWLTMKIGWVLRYSFFSKGAGISYAFLGSGKDNRCQVSCRIPSR